MKIKAIFVLVFFLFITGTLWMQDLEKWGSHYESGELIGYTGLNVNTAISLGATLGAEFILGQVKVLALPLDFSLGIRGTANYYPWWGDDFGFGGYPYLGLHIGQKDLFTAEGLKWLNNFDFYAGAGYDIQYRYWTSTSDDGVFMSFGFHGGINYFLNDSIAIFADEEVTSFMATTTAGVLFKL